MFFRQKPIALGFLLCLCLALPGRSARADSASVTGDNFFVETETGHLGIATRHPASGIDVGAGEVKVGSSGAECTPANEGDVRYVEKRLKFCDGTGWRSVSTSSTYP
jgi:hypothetical protein